MPTASPPAGRGRAPAVGSRSAAKSTSQSPMASARGDMAGHAGAQRIGHLEALPGAGKQGLGGATRCVAILMHGCGTLIKASSDPLAGDGRARREVRAHPTASGCQPGGRPRSRRRRTSSWAPSRRGMHRGREEQEPTARARLEGLSPDCLRRSCGSRDPGVRRGVYPTGRYPWSDSME